MIKIYQKYLSLSFLKFFVIVSLIFFSLVFILNVFEEVSFLKDTDTNIYLPFFLTLLNSPSVLFETFPFIFFISTQFLFIRLLDKEELEIFKKISLTNSSLIIILSLVSFIVSIFIVVFYYNLSSNLKFIYLDIKNKYAQDNKYLAVVTENGLWIKDEINNNINIINADLISDEKLVNVTINQFSKNYENLNNIVASEIIIKDKIWIIEKATFSNNNLTEIRENVSFETNFNSKQINQMFSDLSSLNFFALNKLKNDYENLGYSTTSVNMHFHKLLSYPFNLMVMTIFSAIIMLNIKRNKSKIFHLILGTLCSVLIYYTNYFSGLFGENDKVPEIISIWLPLIIISLFCTIGLVRINEK